MLDHRILTFLTLFREMNYRKTAEVLNMTQPGVTQHIQYLEREYGVKLFIYQDRILHRTPGAEMLKAHFDSLMAKERVLRDQLLRPKTMLHLKVGATKTIGEYVLGSAIRQFLADPTHTLDLTVDNTEVLLGMLEDSQLEFAVIEGVFDKSRYGYHLYKKESFLGICSKDHPFAGKQVSLEQACQENLILREPGSGTRRLLERAMEDKGLRMDVFQRRISVSNFSIIADLVARGIGITFAYAPVAKQREDLATFTVKDMQIFGEFNFVYCDEETALEKIALFFGETLKK